MGDDIQKLFEATEALRQNAAVDAAFGAPIVQEGRTLIPVAKVGYGFGIGFGSGAAEDDEEENGSGGGGGGGSSAQPLGVIEITEAGISVKPIIDEQKIALAGSLLVGWLIFWVAYTLVQIFGKD
ncbi:MAG: hypothetical protein JXD18_10210 [Anaerolineae bacterium]|nr:hypothetical protein [Anaerolineae bacterium]